MLSVSLFRCGVLFVLCLYSCSGHVIPSPTDQPPEIAKIPDNNEIMKWWRQSGVEWRPMQWTSPPSADNEYPRNSLTQPHPPLLKRFRRHFSLFDPIESSKPETGIQRRPHKRKRGALEKKLRWEFDLLTIVNKYNRGMEGIGFFYTTVDYLHRGRRTTQWPLRHKVSFTPGFYITPRTVTKRPVFIKYPKLFLIPLILTYLIAGCCLALCCGELFKTENCFHPKMGILATSFLMTCCCCCPKKAASIFQKKYTNYYHCQDQGCEADLKEKDPETGDLFSCEVDNC